MIQALSEQILSEAQAHPDTSQDTSQAHLKTFAKLRFTMNSLHLIKHSDRENRDLFERLQEQAIDIIIQKSLRTLTREASDIYKWLNLIDLVLNEMPFVPSSRAMAYFETELKILEQFQSFLQVHPELDG